MAPFMKLGKDLDSIEEEQVVPEGAYDLRIKGAELKDTKDGSRKMIEVMLDIEDPDYPNAETVFHYLVFPNEEDMEDEKKGLRMLRGVKRFCHLFKIPVQGDELQVEDFVGSRARANLVQEEYEGRVSNKLRVPRIK